jgi:2-polyprenyl-3-methyl-5-hydroxy-6-metoxy-1,4-benzoquinol methylase
LKSVWQSEFSTQTENGAARARVAACYSERWLRQYAASKLRTDPVFSAAAKLLRESQTPLLDIGCGIGLLPFYLRECGFTPPIIGLEIDARKVQRARVAANGRYEAIEFLEHDVTDNLPAFSGNVAVFDVLHYLKQEDQASLLRAISTRIIPGGMLLIRDAPRENSLRFCLTYLAEIFAQTITWNVGGPMHFPTRQSIGEQFGEKFDREELPMWGGSPFNNRLFIFRRPL